MVDIVNVGLSVDSRSVDKGTKDLKNLGKEAKKTQTATDKMSKSFKLLGAAIATIGVIALTKKLVDQINTYTALSNKLKLVTSDAKNLADVQNILFDVAQDTRASLEGTIDLYSRLARSTKSLGLSQNDLADVTQTINQAIAVSGATAQEASAALFQLGQGLSAGALRGEELNSVMEQTPRLAQAIADGLGVGIAQLRNMGAAGELNAEKVITALKRQAFVIADEFDQTEKTVSQAFQQIENVALKTFGAIDGKQLVVSLDEFRNIISDPEVIKGLQTIASLLIDAATAAIKLTSALPNFGERLGRNLANALAKETTSDRIEDINDRMTKLAIIMKQTATSFEGSPMAAQFIAAREEIARLSEELQALGGGVTPQETQETTVEKDAEKTALKQEALRVQLETEESMRVDAMFESAIREQEENERKSDERDAWNEKELARQQNYYDRLYNMQAGSQQAALKFSQSIRNNDAKSAIENGALMLANQAKTSKTAFEVQRAFSLANAAVALPDAVMQSFRNGGGFPWGLIPAGLMLANGLQQINAIKSATFGGGVSAPSVSGGGASTSPSAPVASGLPDGSTTTPEAIEQPTQITLNVQPDALLTGQVLIDTLEELQDNGMLRGTIAV